MFASRPCLGLETPSYQPICGEGTETMHNYFCVVDKGKLLQKRDDKMPKSHGVLGEMDLLRRERVERSGDDQENC